MVNLIIGVCAILFIPLFFILLQKNNQDYIYIKGVKIPSKYWKTIIFMWYGGILGMVVSLFFRKLFNNSRIEIIIILVFIFIAFYLSKKNKRDVP